MEIKAEKVNPYGEDREKGEQVREMFDNIAQAYDFMNRAMTFGIDKLWRRNAIKELAKQHPANILDVATGTGDMAIMMAKTIPDAKITGVDLSPAMIEIGRRKVEDAKLTDRITFGIEDCLHLPYDDGQYDSITVAYGVRNFQDLLTGYKEMYRVLKPGGTLTVIELSTPTSPVIRPLYKIYAQHIIPFIGRLISKDDRAYTYLPESIAAVPQGEQMTSLMEVAGFVDTHCRPLTFGVCSIYTGSKA